MTPLVTMVVVVTSPAGADARVSSWLEAAAGAFERRTRIAVRSSEQAGLDPADLEACPARSRVACWRERAKESGARFLLMISVLPLEQERRVTAYALDLEGDRFVRTEPAVIGASVRDAERETMERIFGAMTPMIEDAGLLGPPVRTELVTTATVVPSPAPGLRIAVIAGGGVIALGGIALAAVGIARALGAQRIGCIGDAVDCPRAGSPSFGYDGSAGPSTSLKDAEPGGVRMAPLGFSLLTAGGVFSLGTLLFGEESDVPWIQLVAGFAAGAAVYGVIALAGGA